MRSTSFGVWEVGTGITTTSYLHVSGPCASSCHHRPPSFHHCWSESGVQASEASLQTLASSVDDFFRASFADAAKLAPALLLIVSGLGGVAYAAKLIEGIESKFRLIDEMIGKAKAES